jgi:colicin import membrane protein
MTHMPSQQIQKILGEPGRYAIKDGVITDSKTKLQANIRNAQDAAYDIDTEPEPASMTQNALELATFMEMGKNGIPMDPKVIIGKTNLAISEKIRWIKYIEGQQEAASQAAKDEMDLKKSEISNKHNVEMKKLELEMMIAERKADDAQQKDFLKAGIDQEKLDLQKTRDAQTAQIKAVQVMSQARLGVQKEKREWVDMMLDADIAKKRLLLDVAEVMAESKNAQSREAIKATIDMYKLALDNKKMTKENELKYAEAVMDAYVKLDVDGKATTIADKQIESDSAAKVADYASNKQKNETDLKKSASSDKTKLEAEKIKATSSEKIAKTQAEASKAAAKENAKATKEAAKISGDQAKKDKPL